MSEKNEYIADLSVAQRNLNKLLMKAHQKRLRCQLIINNTKCFRDDDREVIGIKLVEVMTVYENDGVP